MAKHGLHSVSVGQPIFDDLVKPADDRTVEKFGMIGRGDNDAVGRITFLEELKERIEHAAHFADIIVRAALAANRVELVEERSEEHTSELQSLMRISYAVLCL